MALKRILLLCLFILLVLDLSAQYRRTRVYRPGQQSEQPGIGLEIGFLNSRGDMGSHDIPVSTFGASAFVSYRIRDHFGVSINALVGTLGDRFLHPYKQYDFRSDIAEFTLRGQLNFEKLLEIEEYNIFPYIGAGAGMMFFKSYGNKFDSNGDPFYYWTDGTVRTESQWDFDWQSIEFMIKDNDYETLLNQANQYNNYAFVIVLEGGAKIRVSPKIFLKAATVYTFTFTDYIDHDLGYRDAALQVRGPTNDDNDGYFFTSVGAMYSFGSKSNRRMIPGSRRRR